MTGALCGTCVDVRLAYRGCLCGPRRLMVVWDGGEWYGEYRTCLKCGEQYGGGEVLARPSRPRWRERNIAQAKRLLERSQTPTEKEGACNAQSDSSTDL